jgi:Na+/H+ antiporter NhaD/arsenite permease-like protein
MIGCFCEQMAAISLFFGASAGGAEPNPWFILPFGLLLFAIAAMPFIHRHFWERYYPHIAVGLGSITVIYYLFGLQKFATVQHTAIEYFSFIVMIGSLFVVAGGIHIKVQGEAKPMANILFLAIGAVLANFIGTTGASMLLIRPWIRMNQGRIKPFHIVFFIFIVSNCGGCLTPIGDPPLFLGYLKGIPFWWPIQNLWREWLVVVVSLLVIFSIFDWRNFARAPRAVREKGTAAGSWTFEGLHNVLFIGVILVGVFLPLGWRELVMVAGALGSYLTTAKAVHQANDFNFHPIKEVAWLFIGIFATMMPALDYLQANAAELGIDSARKYYFMTGAMSGLLDNAPTYLTFLTAAFATKGLSLENTADVLRELQQFPDYVIAVSLGAVFFGAMTYIGNGPNFMVKAIAEQAKVEVPGFFDYIWRYSLPILLPLLILVGYLFIH